MGQALGWVCSWWHQHLGPRSWMWGSLKGCEGRREVLAGGVLVTEGTVTRSHSLVVTGGETGLLPLRHLLDRPPQGLSLLLLPPSPSETPALRTVTHESFPCLLGLRELALLLHGQGSPSRTGHSGCLGVVWESCSRTISHEHLVYAPESFQLRKSQTG